MQPSVVAWLNGAEVWVNVVETDQGVRLRVGLDDWMRMGLVEGQSVKLSRAGQPDAECWLSNVTEVPPLAWITLSRRNDARRLTRRLREPETLPWD